MKLIFLVLLPFITGRCVYEKGHKYCAYPTEAPPPLSEWDYGDIAPHPSPEALTTPVSIPLSSRQKTSSFSYTLSTTATAPIKKSLTHCMSLASTLWQSSVPVSVRINITDFGISNLLGTARPSSNQLIDGKTIAPVALAEAISGRKLNGGTWHIVMTLNGGANWYTGIDGKPMGFDLVTVCLHELYHGLFISSGNIGVSRGRTGYNGVFYREINGRFDEFMGNSEGCWIRGYARNTSLLGRALTGNNLWFVTGSEKIARLHAPTPYKSGSSIYHLSEVEYGIGDNDLMTPSIVMNYAQHDIGSVVRSMQRLILDLKSRARECENIGEPQVEEEVVGGGGGGEEGDAKKNGGFVVKLGGQEISGWILVGGGVGGLVLVVVATFVGCAVCRGGRGGRKEGKQRKRRIADNVNFVDGGNGGGVV